jgi:hypothetical protein
MSKTLTEAERNYKIYDKELLASIKESIMSLATIST